MAKLPMTTMGYATLESELKRRMQVERPRLAERIQQAIAQDPNLVENSEYQIVRMEEAANEARITELEDKLSRTEVINVSRLSGDIIKFGATVALIDEETDEERVWHIVGEPEADVSKGKISVSSPLGRALIGKTKGASVVVEAPGGSRAYRIQRVTWPEA